GCPRSSRLAIQARTSMAPEAIRPTARRYAGTHDPPGPDGARPPPARDRQKTAPFRGLFERKLRRMSASPLAFLRGAAPLFYLILAEPPFLAEGPEGEGWLTGDMHLENFGAYRPDPHSFGKGDDGDRRATFDLNDFDDAIVGPLRFDVLRLTTSLILGGRELGADGVMTLELCDRLLDAYARAAFGSG